jgi:glycosyltransferase involved in cell wall biosynthesis
MSDLAQLAQEISDSGLFDEIWYLDRYRDVGPVSLPALAHFVRFGLMLERDPGPGFDTHYYRESNADVAEAALTGMHPLVHYIRFGRPEGRRPVRERLARVGSPLREDGTMAPGPHWHAGVRVIDPERRTILLCAHSSDQHLFGGERSLMDVLHALSFMPFNIIVTLPSVGNQDYVENIRQSCAGVYSFAYPQWMANHDPYAWSVLDFADIIARHDVDIVHANTIVLIEPVVAAKRMGRIAVIHVRELISLDEVLQRRMKQTGEDIVGTVFHNSDWLIGNSRATCALFDRGPRTLYVPNAITVEDFAIPNLLGDEIRFGIVSSNAPKKGIADFVEVARRAAVRSPQAKFVIVGPATTQIDQGGTPRQSDLRGL